MKDELMYKLNSLDLALREAITNNSGTESCLTKNCDNPDCPLCDARVMMNELAIQPELTDKQREEFQLMSTIEEFLEARDEVDSIEQNISDGIYLEVTMKTGYIFNVTIEQTNADEG